MLDEVRRIYLTSSISLLAFHLMRLCNGEEGLVASFRASLANIQFRDVPADNHIRITGAERADVERNLCGTLQDRAKLPRKGVEIIYGPRIAICAKLPTGRGTFMKHGIDAYAKERHICCTWIDVEGNVRCSCIGSTEFRARMLTTTFMESCCRHSDAFISFLELLGSIASLPPLDCGKRLAEIAAARFQWSLLAYFEEQPHFVYSHGAQLAILVLMDRKGDIQFIPIRCVKQAGSHFICAFCDLSWGKQCEHVSLLHSLLLHGGPLVPVEPGLRSEDPEKAPGDTDTDPMAGINVVLHLPLSIVSCSAIV